MLDSFFQISLGTHIFINLWGIPLYLLLVSLVNKKKINLNKRIKNKQTLFFYCMIIVIFGYVMILE